MRLETILSRKFHPLSFDNCFGFEKVSICLESPIFESWQVEYKNGPNLQVIVTKMAALLAALFAAITTFGGLGPIEHSSTKSN